jgi:hypothetical protein
MERAPLTWGVLVCIGLRRGRENYFFEVVLYVFETDAEWDTLEEDLAAFLD